MTSCGSRQAQFLNERERSSRFLGNETVRPAFNHATVYEIRFDDTAQPWPLFNQDVGNPGARQIVSGGKVRRRPRRQ